MIPPNFAYVNSAWSSPSSTNRCPCRLIITPYRYDSRLVLSVSSRSPYAGASALIGVAWHPLHCPHGIAPISSAIRSPSPWLCIVPRTFAWSQGRPRYCARHAMLASNPPHPSTTARAVISCIPPGSCTATPHTRPLRSCTRRRGLEPDSLIRHPRRGVVRVRNQDFRQLRIGAIRRHPAQIFPERVARIGLDALRIAGNLAGLRHELQDVLGLVECDSQESAAVVRIPAAHLLPRLFEHQHTFGA